MKFRNVLISVALTSCLALGLSGCGGDGKDSLQTQKDATNSAISSYSREAVTQSIKEYLQSKGQTQTYEDARFIDTGKEWYDLSMRINSIKAKVDSEVATSSSFVSAASTVEELGVIKKDTYEVLSNIITVNDLSRIYTLGKSINEGYDFLADIENYNQKDFSKGHWTLLNTYKVELERVLTTTADKKEIELIKGNILAIPTIEEMDDFVNGACQEILTNYAYDDLAMIYSEENAKSIVKLRDDTIAKIKNCIEIEDVTKAYIEFREKVDAFETLAETQAKIALQDAREKVQELIASSATLNNVDAFWSYYYKEAVKKAQSDLSVFDSAEQLYNEDGQTGTYFELKVVVESIEEGIQDFADKKELAKKYVEYANIELGKVVMTETNRQQFLQNSNVVESIINTAKNPVDYQERLNNYAKQILLEDDFEADYAYTEQDVLFLNVNTLSQLIKESNLNVKNLVSELKSETNPFLFKGDEADLYNSIDELMDGDYEKVIFGKEKRQEYIKNYKAQIVQAFVDIYGLTEAEAKAVKKEINQNNGVAFEQQPEFLIESDENQDLQNVVIRMYANPELINDLFAQIQLANEGLTADVKTMPTAMDDIRQAINAMVEKFDYTFDERLYVEEELEVINHYKAKLHLLNDEVNLIENLEIPSSEVKGFLDRYKELLNDIFLDETEPLINIETVSEITEQFLPMSALFVNMLSIGYHCDTCELQDYLIIQTGKFEQLMFEREQKIEELEGLYEDERDFALALASYDKELLAVCEGMFDEINEYLLDNFLTLANYQYKQQLIEDYKGHLETFEAMYDIDVEVDELKQVTVSGEFVKGIINGYAYDYTTAFTARVASLWDKINNAKTNEQVEELQALMEEEDFGFEYVNAMFRENSVVKSVEEMYELAKSKVDTTVLSNFGVEQFNEDKDNVESWLDGQYVSTTNLTAILESFNIEVLECVERAENNSYETKETVEEYWNEMFIRYLDQFDFVGTSPNEDEDKAGKYLEDYSNLFRAMNPNDQRTDSIIDYTKQAIEQFNQFMSNVLEDRTEYQIALFQDMINSTIEDIGLGIDDIEETLKVYSEEQQLNIKEKLNTLFLIRNNINVTYYQNHVGETIIANSFNEFAMQSLFNAGLVRMSILNTPTADEEFVMLQNEKISYVEGLAITKITNDFEKLLPSTIETINTKLQTAINSIKSAVDEQAMLAAVGTFEDYINDASLDDSEAIQIAKEATELQNAIEQAKLTLTAYSKLGFYGETSQGLINGILAEGMLALEGVTKVEDIEGVLSEYEGKIDEVMTYSEYITAAETEWGKLNQFAQDIAYRVIEETSMQEVKVILVNVKSHITDGTDDLDAFKAKIEQAEKDILALATNIMSCNTNVTVTDIDEFIAGTGTEIASVKKALTLKYVTLPEITLTSGVAPSAGSIPAFMGYAAPQNDYTLKYTLLTLFVGEGVTDLATLDSAITAQDGAHVKVLKLEEGKAVIAVSFSKDAGNFTLNFGENAGNLANSSTTITLKKLDN